MLKFFVVHRGSNNILGVLDQQPEHVPDGYEIVKYNGYVPIRYLECKNGSIVPNQGAPSQDPELEQLRAQAIRAITDTAARLLQQAKADCSFNIPSYHDLFEEKVQQSLDYITTPSEDTAKFPLLNSESVATGISINEVARMILFKKSNWIAAVSKIDQLLLRGQFAIANVNNQQQIQTIKNQILTELLSMSS